MKHGSIFLIVFLLAACTTASANEPEHQNIVPELAMEPSNLPDLGEAPELDNEVWLNTSEPLRLAELRGQVILLDMWTFG